MRILYILKHNPWGIGGGCYACNNYFTLLTEVFKKATFDVLICEEYIKNIQFSDFINCKFIPVRKRNKISLYLSPITGILHRHQQIATKLLNKNHYDYCIFDHNSIAGSLVDLCMEKGVKTIVLNHNCELEYYRDNNNWIRNIFVLPAVKKNERNSFLKSDYNIFLTEEDKILFNENYGESSTNTIVGGCFLAKNEVIHKNTNKFNIDNPKIVISGTIGNIQNIDGINYFFDELYSILPNNVEIIITGKNPTVSLQERIKNYHNVKIIANPENILDIVKSCDIFLCPTRLGGGMKLRIMDGIRCGLPIISHKVSARGYKFLENKGLLYSFENKEEFISSYNLLLEHIKNNINFKDELYDKCKLITFDKKLDTFSNIFSTDI